MTTMFRNGEFVETNETAFQPTFTGNQPRNRNGLVARRTLRAARRANRGL